MLLPLRIHRGPAWARLAHPRLPCATPAIRAPRPLSTSSPCRRVRTQKAYDELPFVAVDAEGKPREPLPPLEDVKPVKRTRKKKEAVVEPAAAAAPASDDRTEELGPDSQPWPPLAKEVLSNLARFPNCILLTRVGGFYEIYFEQAPHIASLLGIKLASRTWGGRTVAMAGFPLSQLEKYLEVLVQEHGKLVAICEEFKTLEGDADAPATASVEITRRVTRVVSKGTLLDEKFLDPFSSNWILSVGTAKEGSAYGLAWLDVSTADFHTMTCDDAEALRDEVARIKPTEVLLEQEAFEAGHALWEAVDPAQVLVSFVGQHDAQEQPHLSSQTWSDALETPAALPPTQETSPSEAQAVLNLTRHLKSRLLESSLSDHVTGDGPLHHVTSQTMRIDAATLAALEVRESLREGGGARGTLLSTIRRTTTKGGARLLEQWLTSPSTSLRVIHRRQSLVAALVASPFACDDVRSLLRRGAGDVSRSLQRIVTSRNDEQDLLEVRDFSVLCHDLRTKAREEREGWHVMGEALERLAPLNELGRLLAESIDENVMEKRIRSREALEAEGDEANATPTSKPKAKARVVEDESMWGAPFEHLIRPSVSKRLHTLTKEHASLRRSASKLQASLRERYRSNLSLRFMQGQGFVVHFSDFRERERDAETSTPSPMEDMTFAYKSKSTRTFYLDAWTQIGARLMRLDAELRRAEGVELQRLRQRVLDERMAIRRNARLVDELDVLASFAHLAGEMRLCRPEVVGEGRVFEVRDARHLGVEMGLLDAGRGFTPNDVTLRDDSRVHIITGPNMGGKSTYLRSVAVISILAQCGSYVPATSARLSLVDRIFSRVGARDDLSRDRSTFMCEMLETSAFLRRATESSLVIADEIGRGTTTDVGLAIAHATLWYLHERVGCRSLFATHLHEVVDLVRGSLHDVDMFCTDVVEREDGSISYSHRLRPGVNRESHGLRVAQLAGMPDGALQAAQTTLDWLRNSGTPHERESVAALRQRMKELD